MSRRLVYFMNYSDAVASDESFLGLMATGLLDTTSILNT